MRKLLIILMLLSTTASARELWSDDGFVLHTAGWDNQTVFQEWLGVKLLLTIPENGWMMFEGPGSLELYFPKLGWRKDIGIIFMYGCNPHPDEGRDSRGGVCGINYDFACYERGDRVMAVVRVRRFNPTRDNRPTKARWIRREMNYGKD